MATEFEGDDDSAWLEGVPAEVAPQRGELMTKQRVANVLGFAPMTLDRYIKEGAPVESRGSRKVGWRINSAALHAWIVGYKIQQATGSDELVGFDAAKTREKNAQATLKELQLEKTRAALVPIEEVTQVYERELGVLRSALLAIPSRIGCDAVTRDAIRAEINTALTEISGERRTDEGESHG